MSEISDSTVARIAGNLLSGDARWQEEPGRDKLVEAAVDTAERIAERVTKRRRQREKAAATKPIGARQAGRF